MPSIRLPVLRRALSPCPTRQLHPRYRAVAFCLNAQYGVASVRQRTPPRHVRFPLTVGETVESVHTSPVFARPRWDFGAGPLTVQPRLGCRSRFPTGNGQASDLLEEQTEKQRRRVLPPGLAGFPIHRESTRIAMAVGQQLLHATVSGPDHIEHHGSRNAASGHLVPKHAVRAIDIPDCQLLVGCSTEGGFESARMPAAGLEVTSCLQGPSPRRHRPMAGRARCPAQRCIATECVHAAFRIHRFSTHRAPTRGARSAALRFTGPSASIPYPRSRPVGLS